MEKYIDLINAYLQKTLSESEILAFETKLQTDTEFNTTYQEHLVILNGIQRVEISEQIKEARQNYVKAKWLKYLGISIGILLVSILAYSLIRTSPNVESSNPSENNAVEFVSDSIKIEIDTIVEFKTHTILAEKEKIIKEATKTDNVIVAKKEVIDKSTASNVIAFLKPYQKLSENKKINTEEDVLITFKEGTKISIPANAFIDAKTGKPITGKIDLEVKEFYKLSDILMANLTTKSDDKILETGGMLYIDATQNGSKLKLKPEKKINIVFKNSGKEGMQLFSGEERDSGINWLLNEQLESLEVDELIGEVEAVEVNPAVSVRFGVTPTYNGCEDQDKDCTINEITKFMSRKFNTEIISGRQRIYAMFKVDETGTVTEVRTRNADSILDLEFKRILMTLPQMKPAKKNGKAIASQLVFPIVISDGLDDLIVNNSLTGTITTNPTLGRRENGSSLNSPKLGWINCDRFVRSKKKKIKYKLKIKDSEGANVKMIFKSINSVLPSRRINGDYSFGEIPIDEEVILLVIKKKGDKLYLGFKDLKTKAVSELDLEFKEVTIDELKAELMKLNKTFD